MDGFPFSCVFACVFLLSLNSQEMCAQKRNSNRKEGTMAFGGT
jgi:hypothetical protein